jgi:hypothetical protein
MHCKQINLKSKQGENLPNEQGFLDKPFAILISVSSSWGTTGITLFVLKTFYSSSGCVAEQTKYRREFSLHVPPSRHIIYQLVRPFKESVSSRGKHSKGRNGRLSVTTKKVISTAVDVTSA